MKPLYIFPEKIPEGKMLLEINLLFWKTACLSGAFAVAYRKDRKERQRSV